MNDLDLYVEGCCNEMCPSDEVKMREQRKLLHILEMVPGTQSSKKPKADVKKVVKAFQRSAAGKYMTDKNNLRTPNALLYTVHYLLNDIACSNKYSWKIKYDFIMDRLRAVRQDMIIQNLSRSYYVLLLQPIVRFYAFTSYRLVEENLNVFDPDLHKTHLIETLKRLLCIYDEYDRVPNIENMDIELLNSRPEFEALYILMNLGDETALRRSFTLPKIWRTSIVHDAMSISFFYLTNNYIKICRKIETLPPLLCAVGSLHMPKIRKTTLKMMSVAYNSSNLKFPLEHLQNFLLYGAMDNVVKDCKHYGLETEENYVFFKKNVWKENKMVRPIKEKFVENKIQELEENSLLFFDS